jgi:hypothetical protein
VSGSVVVGADSPEEREILAVPEAAPQIDFAFLFGSRTRAGARPDSLSGDEAYWREFHARERERRLAEGRFGRP